MPLQPINFGDRVQSVSINKFKGSEGCSYIVSLQVDLVQAAYIYFHENTGYFYAFNGMDIDVLGPPNLRYIIPVIVYSGGLEKYGAPLAIEYYPAGEKVYEELLRMDKIERQRGVENGLSDCDLTATCEIAKYQKFDFRAIGDCVWRKDPAMAKQVAGMRETYQKLIPFSVARELSEDKFLELMGKTREEVLALRTDANPPAEIISSEMIATGQQPQAQPQPQSISTEESGGDSMALDEFFESEEGGGEEIPF